MNMDWNGGGRPPMSDAPNYQHHPPFHPIGLNTSLEKFLHQQNTSASSLLKSGPPGGAADLWDCPTIKSNSYYCWNLNDDSGFVDNSMTFNDSRQNFADRGSKERNDVKTDDDRVNVLLESAQIAFDAAVRKARFEPIHSPSWAKQNLPGAGKHTWTIFKPDEIREKFRIATPADASRPVDLSMKGTGSSSTSPKARPTILNKSTSSTSPRTVNIELVAANGFDVSELPLTRIKPSKSVVATDTSSKHKEKRKKKVAADQIDGKSLELNKSLSNMEWLEKLENQSLKNSAEKGTLLTEQQLKKVQNECGSIKRPPFSYMHLVMLAINSTTDKRMTLQEIYRWIETTFPYFKYHAKAGWKNSIRHNLSLYNIFVREPAINADDNNTKSKLSYWTIKTDKVGYRKKNRKPSDTSKKRAPRPIMPNLPHIHVMPVTGQSSTSKPYMMLKATIPGHTPILPKPSNDCPVFTGVVTVSTKNNCKNAADHDRTPTTPQITVSDASAPSVQPITSTPVCGEKTVPKINRKRHQNNKQEAQTTTTRQTSSKHAKTERGLSVEMPHVYLSPSFMDCSNIQSPSNDWSIFNLRQQHPLPRNFSDSGIEMPIDLSGFTTESTPGKLRPPHEFASTEKHSRKSRKPRSSSCGIGSNNGRNAQAVNCNKENGLLTQHRAEVGVKVESQFVVDSSAAVRFDEPDSSFHEKSLIDFDAFQSLRSHVLLTPPRLATKSSDATMKTSTPHKETFLTLKSSSPKWNGGAAAVCTPLKRVTTPFKPSTPKNTIETPADTALNTPAQIRLDSSHLESPVTPRNNTGVSSSRNKISPSPGRLLNSSFGMMPLTGFTPLRGIRQISGINDSFGDVFPDLQLDDQLLHDNGVMPIDLGNLSWLTNADLTDSHLEISHH